MSALLGLLARERLVAALVGLLLVVGGGAWLTMPRQEDPSFIDRFATVIVPWPGADALRVERLVVRPLEDALADVPEIREVEATARSGVAVVRLQLRDEVYRTTEAWDEVREALDAAVADLPDGAGPIDFDADIGDPASVVLLITGSDDLLALRDASRTVEDRLLRVPGVARVDRIADPGEQLSVRLDPALADRLGLDARALAASLRARNAVAPGGTLVIDGRRVVLQPRAELADLQAFRDTPVLLPGGAAVPLGELASVTLEPAVPASERIFHDGAAAVGLAVVPVLPADLVALGDRVSAAVDEVSADIAPLSVERFAFQPDQVRSRLAELTGSLLLGVLVVAAVLLLSMGPRLGAVVASVVPLVAISTVAVYAAGGGVLHQISVAALVLALGLLVDNAIVVAESIQRHLDAGLAPDAAAARAVGELAVPLGTATGTTVAAFVPMLLSTGGTADFTRAIPVVVILTLVLSYAFALAVTPAVSARLLRPSPDRADDGRWDRAAERLGRTVVARPGLALGAVGVALAASLLLLPAVRQQFFPLSDRPRVLVTVELPEGSHLSGTLAVVEALEADLGAIDGVRAITSFVGRGTPRFYYNLNDVPRSPHAATLVATLDDVALVPGVVDQVRALSRTLPEATIVPHRLQQGPPVGAPVELRIDNPRLDGLLDATEAVVRVLRQVPGTRDVRHDLGVGMPTLVWDIDDAAAGRRGLAREDVAVALLARTRGVPAGEVRHGREPVDVVVGSPDGERTLTSALSTTTVARPGQLGVPLPAVAAERVQWTPAAVHRTDRRRVVTVSAELAAGASFAEVVAAASPALDALDLPGTSLAWGGEAEGSSEANGALLRTVPVGLGLLLLFLLLEFDSFRRVGIVLVTVPLAAVGVIPGLALSGQPFGFMSLLGVIALVGIVVNNAIVLLDRVDTGIRAGAAPDDALVAAVRLRARPILLTTGTTVAGMLPLALSDSPLWPPLAWAMISGLVASTGLTLVAVPALFRVLIVAPPRLPRLRSNRWLAAAAVAALPAIASAAPVTLEQALLEGADAPVAAAANHSAAAASADATAAWLGALAPGVGVSLTAVRRDAALAIQTPVGPFQQVPEQLQTYGAEVRVPLLDPGALARAPAASRAAAAGRHAASRTRQLASLAAGEAWLDVVALDAEREATAAYVASLDRVARDLADRVRADLGVPVDALRAEVTLLDARQAALALDRRREVLTWQLGAALGRPEAVEPTGDLPAPAPAAGSGAGREDLDALDDRIRALRASRTAIAAEALPVVGLYGAYAGSDQENLVDQDWFEAGVRFDWTPVAGGTRPARIAAAKQRIAEAEAERERLSLGVGVEVRAAAAALEVASAEVAVRQRAVQQAEEARDQVSDRYGQGLATFTDLLQVEAELRAQRTRLRVAEVEVVRGALRHQAARGS